jgi:hypothetical protein
LAEQSCCFQRIAGAGEIINDRVHFFDYSIFAAGRFAPQAN